MPVIVGGTAKGRRIKLPPGDVRPATSKVRQSTFDYLGEFILGVRVLDLYSGSGGMGFEALSRGASSCVFVDISERVLRVTRENTETLKFSDRCRFIAKDVFRFLKSWTDYFPDDPEKYDLLIVSPPYKIAEPQKLFEEIGKSEIIAKGGCVCIEYSRHTDHPEPEGFTLDRRRVYGETVMDIWDFGLDKAELPNDNE